MTHGGKRPGAGRPRKEGAKQTLSVRIAPDIHEYLSSKMGTSRAIEDMVRKTAAFRAWKNSRKSLPES